MPFGICPHCVMAFVMGLPMVAVLIQWLRRKLQKKVPHGTCCGGKCGKEGNENVVFVHDVGASENDGEDARRPQAEA